MSKIAYPRPNLKRDNWLNLNGEWDFCFDNNYDFSSVSFDKKIVVPFVYQCEDSGLNIKEDHEVVWYKKEFNYKKNDDVVILHFGAVDYYAKVYLNGEFIGENEGGYLPFSFDVSNIIKDDNELVVRVYDPPFDESIPRGKQYWKEKPEAIWYTRSTGIWQTVWLESITKEHITNIMFTPDLDSSSIKLDLNTNVQVDELIFEVRKDNQLIIDDRYKMFETSISREINLLDSHIFRTSFHDSGWLWYPENPNLFDVVLKLVKDGEVVDVVESYFGMRKVHYENGELFLNNKPYYTRLVLDQGYWPTSLLSAPTDDAFGIDIELAKKMGFNGCRKHQKIEDPNFLYECDKRGFLVWGEIAAAPIYNHDVVRRMTNEFSNMILRDYNHPSIVVWVCLNESWAVPKIKWDKMQQAFSLALYNTAKALDNTRLVISNDGWSMTESDICAIHNYNHGNKDEVQKYEKYKESLGVYETVMSSISSGHPVYANGYSHGEGVPIVLSEFGGVALRTGDSKNGDWGYSVSYSKEDYINDLGRIMDAIYESKLLYGFCYTQLTDVEQETNGLVNYDRTIKVDLNLIREKIMKS